MRAAPALTVNATRDGGWRVLVAACAGASAMALAAWLAARLAISPLSTAAVVACAGAVASLLAWRASRLAPVRLAFDSQRWWVESAGNAAPLPGRIAVVIDLGSWLLLRFDAEALRARAPRWLPIARASLPLEWHALRCAIHAPPRTRDRAADAASSP